MNNYPNSTRFHHQDPKDLTALDDLSTKQSTSQQGTPRAFRRGNQEWHDSCQSGFSSQNPFNTESSQIYCHDSNKSLSNASDFTKLPSQLHSTAYLPPITRSMNLNPSHNTSLRASPQQNNEDDLDTFSVTFFRRITHSEDSSNFSEDTIPIVQFAPNQERSTNESVPEAITVRNIARGIRLVRQIRRFLQIVQNLNRSNESNEADWNVQMDEGYSFPCAVIPTSFPCILFSFGRRSISDTSELNAMIENFFSGRSEGKPPASLSSINKLPGFIFGDRKQIKAGHECTICQVDYRLGDRLLRLPCSHDYHKDCVVKWLKQHDSCPMCRRSIEAHEMSTN